MTSNFRLGMSACAFIVDGRDRYLETHGGEKPAERVFSLSTSARLAVNCAYLKPGDGLMVMEAGKRIGGADLRYVYKESDLSPRCKLP